MGRRTASGESTTALIVSIPEHREARVEFPDDMTLAEWIDVSERVCQALYGHKPSTSIHVGDPASPQSRHRRWLRARTRQA